MTRRGVLGLAGIAWADVAAAQHEAHRARAAGEGFRVLRPEEARLVEELAERILPAGPEGPGAREAGAAYFIDRALASFAAGSLPLYRQQIAELRNKKAAVTDELLRSMEGTEFFGILRTHTVMGFLGNPSYGGNRNQAGWRLIGFEDAMHFEPPFGYYDKEGR